MTMADQIHTDSEGTAAVPVLDDIEAAGAALREKLTDAETPGFEAELDPEEAALAGAFTEDALSEADARDSAIDLPLPLAAV
jgi:hypothetical protein